MNTRRCDVPVVKKLSLRTCTLLSSLSLTIILTLSSGVAAIEITDGFNYPVGPRNLGSVTIPDDDDGWYDAQNFQFENTIRRTITPMSLEELQKKRCP